MKNKITKRYLRGKKSYDWAMRHWKGQSLAFKNLTLKEQRYWQSET